MSYVHAYPLARSGGLFLALVGFAILLGAFWFPSRNKLLAGGAALAAIVTAVTAAGMTRPFGAPTVTQVVWLGAAVLLEILLIPLAVGRYYARGERFVTLVILTIVGLHFLPMTPAFGPVVAALAILCTANALAAVRFPGYELRTVWAVDGALKAAVGALMACAQGS